MTLRDVIERLDEFDDDQAIFAESAAPTARALVEAEDASVTPELPYLLEVSLAREAIDVWQAWRPGRAPTLEDRLEAVVYYAENDAWLPAG